MRLGDMAHLPGGGPDDTRCSDCDHYWVRGKQGRCRKAAELRGRSVVTLDPIPSTSYSCKYFEAMAVKRAV